MVAPLLGGLWILGALVAFGILAAGAYVLLCKLIYWACVFGAVVLRCSQTPAEAQGGASWMTLAEEWYLKVPGVLK